MRIRGVVWTIAAAVVAAAFFAIALRADVYEATSPHWLPWHVGLRKLYSVGAFSVVAFFFRRALVERGATRMLVARCILGTALYSAAIEAGQFLVGSREGIGWNLFDTACGALGGALASADVWLVRRFALTRPRVPARLPR